jgi:hypothetical protein
MLSMKPVLLAALLILAPIAAQAQAPASAKWSGPNVEPMGAMAAGDPIDLGLRKSGADAAAKNVAADTARTYPPSCLDYPLPTPVHGEPMQTATFAMQNQFFNRSDDWTIVVFRRPCAGVPGRSVVLIYFEDQTPGTDIFPVYPFIRVTQHGVSGFARVSADPRDRAGDAEDSPVLASGQSLVLQSALPLSFDPNEPFLIEFGYSAFTLSGQIFAYNPAAFPSAGQPLTIDGYVTGSYSDPTHGGEGILFEVGERSDGNLFVFFSWFTYDDLGIPFWIVGNTDIGKNLTTVGVPALVLRGGGFAGNFTPPLQSEPWGAVRFTFPDCDSMRLQFQSTTSQPGVPTGQGFRNWKRLSNINGLLCK